MDHKLTIEMISKDKDQQPRQIKYVCPDCRFCIDGDTDCELKHDFCDGTGCDDYEPFDNEIK